MYYKMITLCERISSKILNTQISIRNIYQLNDSQKEELKKDIDSIINNLRKLKNKI